ncbi:hypothetical protein DAPPUDRAFT_311082 [Daphnia pulex]|uniref:Chitin-binding type-2 domain-containing protein n=1 Tax=Daphnia pulex TaxID=6669 RepID=E9FUK6_DAPPU|nr:hypothetical protein DAPPUDRAFT_311082 [Daphnia pulex]|eukprot:EFX88745.1 hypothetical protein DAPPUDRAFT_311082 [Daphnia pulex]
MCCPLVPYCPKPLRTIIGERNSALCENAGDGFYAFPDNPNCNPNYYACIGGVQYNQTCPGNSVFEPTYGNCLSPDTAPSCKITTTTPVSTTTVKATTTTTAPFSCTSDGFYPVGTCSTSYYACVGGVVYPQTCPGNGIFDPSKSACVAPESLPSCPPITSTVPVTTTIPSTSTVTTPSTTVATTTLTSTTTAPPTSTTTITTTPASTGTTIFTCTQDGFFPMGSCLSTYYACVGGISYVQTCPGNGIFVDTKCVTPQDVIGCDTTTSTTMSSSTTISTTMSSSTTTVISTTTASTTSTVSSVAPFTCPTPEGFYPIPGACSADYFICVSGSPYVQSCPIGQVFNPKTQYCEPPINVPLCYFSFVDFYQVCVLGSPYVSTCPNGTVFDPVTKLCTPIGWASCTSPFTCPTPDGFFPIPGACSNSYYTCVGNQAYLQGLHGYGGSRATGDIEIGPDPNFQCPEGTSVAPHPEKCGLYYTCYFASPVTLWQCYSNYLFDVTYSSCNYPESTDCGNRQRSGPTITATRTKSAADSPPSTSPVFNCPSAGGFFPVSPEECYQHYYTCAGGVAYVMLCPTDGLFDPVTLTCKPANEVSCKDPAFTCTADGFYPVEGECTGVYFVCASGVAYESVCPNNGIFDPDRGICASPDTVPCAQDRKADIDNAKINKDYYTKCIENMCMAVYDVKRSYGGFNSAYYFNVLTYCIIFR